MTDPRPRLVVFGDSHYAAIRKAHNEGLFDPSGVDLEYWGHLGNRFNFLSFQDGAIVPTDDFTARRFAKFNERQRTRLPAADFDAALFMGARIAVAGGFLTLARNALAGRRISGALRRRILADQLRLVPTYGYAKGFIAAGTRVFLAPISFPTEGDPHLVLTPEEVTTLDRMRAGIWDELSEIAADDGIVLLTQSDETVTGGLFTRAEYAVEGYETTRDHHHKGAAWGALVMNRVLADLT